MVVAIVPAAGRGRRLRADPPKQFLTLNGFPLITYTLRTLHTVDAIDTILIVAPKGYESFLYTLCCEHGFAKVCRIVLGGPERQDSVANALQTEEISSAEYVLIHDAVRPLAPPE
ncbi:MAG: 2-C-methyl-D-erythritol 4-phosphate cytidylyltransferase, partial [Candidatus Kapabacteria bacterium]|nr:2-C-methyl-D-erythritol 4-phosphate cytidylyltransferase [Candidatus Kapabacteria bacterium]